MAYADLIYTRSPARYAKNMVAIQCPSEDHYKSRAATVLEEVAGASWGSGRSLRFSGRESSYIVSKRVADKFEARVAELRM